MLSKVPLHRLLLVPALLALLLAAWAGLVRMGWTLPPVSVAEHGPLMISGFLGTLIALERAVALAAAFKRGWWAYAAPLLSAAGMAALVIGAPRVLGIGLIALGSLGLVVIFLALVRRQPALFAVTMALGAACWLIGNLLWLSGLPIYRLVEWWIAFLVLTIAGERLELSRILRHSKTSQTLFISILVVYGAGLLLTTFQIVFGTPLIGVILIALSLWLFRYDIARRTVRQTGLTRYIAVCLLAGYGWMLIGGVLRIAFGPQIAGAAYDAELHSVLLGFVFSMILGHAPIILPAVLRVNLPYRRWFYLPLALLHSSLLLRIGGDVSTAFTLRQWGGMLNVIAILLFLGITITTIYSASRRRSGITSADLSISFQHPAAKTQCDAHQDRADRTATNPTSSEHR